MKRLMLLALLPFFSMINASAAQPAVMIQSESVTIHVKADGSVEKNVSVTMKLNTFPALPFWTRPLLLSKMRRTSVISGRKWFLTTDWSQAAR